MKLPLILGLVGLLLLVGCSGQKSIADVKLHSGTEGISFSLLKNAPDTVLEGSPFTLSFQLKNEGAYSVALSQPGLLALTLEPDLIALDSWDVSQPLVARGSNLFFPLQGKQLANSQGEIRRGSVLLKAKDIDYTRERTDTLIAFNLCYPYRTLLEEQVCIDPDPNGISEKSCEAKDLSFSGQGAPLVITAVEQTLLPGRDSDETRIQFTITAQNKGKGIILDPANYEEDCRGGGNQSQLVVSSFTFSDFTYRLNEGGEIECLNPMREGPEGFTTRCTLKEGHSIPKSALSFTTPVSIELSYGYKETYVTKIGILDSGR